MCPRAKNGGLFVKFHSMVGLHPMVPHGVASSLTQPVEIEIPITHMKTSTKRIVALLCIGSLLTIAGMGCNTARGFGKDVEKTGEKIQDGTK